MMDISKQKGFICFHCDKSIKGYVYHFDEYKTRQHEEYGTGGQFTDVKWIFCNSCMSIVVGVGFN